MIDLKEAKDYLRLDGDYEDDIILSLISIAGILTKEVARDDEIDKTDERYKIAMFYCISYLYENRDNANFNELKRMLRSLFSGIRKENF